MTYAIKYHPEVIEDLQQLGGNVRKQVFKKIEQLAQNPQLGHSLGNKAGFDLTGYRKAYVDNRRIRIVYKIVDKQICIFIISVGKREGLEVYQTAQQRIKNLPETGD